MGALVDFWIDGWVMAMHGSLSSMVASKLAWLDMRGRLGVHINGEWCSGLLLLRCVKPMFAKGHVVHI